MSNASAAYTQILATTAVDSYLSVGSTESFFVGSSQKYATFALTHVKSNQNTMNANSQSITIERDGDYLAGIAVYITGPGLHTQLSTGSPATLNTARPGVRPAKENIQDYPSALNYNAGSHDNAIANVSRQFDVCARYCNFAPCHMIKSAELKIGNVVMDTLVGEQVAAYYQSFCEVAPPEMLNAGGRYDRARMALRDNVEFIVPLPFSFFTSYSKTLNLLAISYNTLVLNLTMVDPTTRIENSKAASSALTFEDLATTPNTYAVTDATKYGTSVAPAIGDYQVGLLSTYVYVSQEERQARLNETSDVVFLQHQISTDIFTGADSESNQNSLDLNFNFPVHALMFCPRSSGRVDAQEVGCYLGEENVDRMSADNVNGWAEKLLANITVLVNNQERVNTGLRNFMTDFTHQRHAVRQPSHHNHMYLYPFGLHSPYQGDPSGSLNFSRLASCKANFTLGTFSSAGKIGSVSCNVIALNWNIVNFSGGSATLRFSS